MIQHNTQKLFDRRGEKVQIVQRHCLNMISIAKCKQQDKYEFLNSQLHVICQVGNSKVAFAALSIAEKHSFVVEQMRKLQRCTIRK